MPGAVAPGFATSMRARAMARFGMLRESRFLELAVGLCAAIGLVAFGHAVLSFWIFADMYHRLPWLAVWLTPLAAASPIVYHRGCTGWTGSKLRKGKKKGDRDRPKPSKAKKDDTAGSTSPKEKENDDAKTPLKEAAMSAVEDEAYPTDKDAQSSTSAEGGSGVDAKAPPEDGTEKTPSKQDCKDAKLLPTGDDKPPQTQDAATGPAKTISKTTSKAQLHGKFVMAPWAFGFMVAYALLELMVTVVCMCLVSLKAKWWMWGMFGLTPLLTALLLFVGLKTRLTAFQVKVWFASGIAIAVLYAVFAVSGRAIWFVLLSTVLKSSLYLWQGWALN